MLPNNTDVEPQIQSDERRPGNLQDAMEYASQNPESDFARQLKLYIQTGNADEEAKSLGVDVSKFGRQTTPDFVPRETNNREFVEELVPASFGVGGGIIGGMLGAPGGPAGIIGGAGLGATIGGALGEGVQQTIEDVFGGRTKFDANQILKSGIESGLTQSLFPLMGQGYKVASAALPKTNPGALVNIMRYFSGYPKEVVERALQRTSGAITGVKEGESALVDVIKRTAGNIQEFANKTLAEGRTKIAEISKLTSGTPSTPGTRQGILEAGRDFYRNITDTLRSNYRIGVNKLGELEFSRPAMPSNIVSRADQSTIQDAYNLMKGIQNNTTVKNIDAILERMIVLRSKTPAGSPTGGETRKIVGEMMNEVIGFVRSLGNVSKGYTEYADFLAENLPTRVFIRDAKEMFGATANITAKEISQIEVRLLQLFNQGRLATREFAEKIGEKVGTDPVGTAAGTLLKAGEEISVRAQNLTKRGVIEKVLEAIPRAAIRSFVESGNIAPMLSNPLLVRTAKALDISVRELAQMVVNLSGEKTTDESPTQQTEE